MPVLKVSRKTVYEVTPEIVRIPSFRQGIKVLQRVDTQEEWQHLGFDTETIDGDPYSFQLWGQNVAQFVRANVKTILPKFIEHIRSWAKDKSGLYSVWAHNLMFDLGILFTRYPHLWRDDVVEAEIEGLRWWILTRNPIHAKLYLPGGVRVTFLDTGSFFSTDHGMKLETLCDLLGTPVKKMKRPVYLGKRAPTETELPYFKKYAMVDAQAVWYVAKTVLDMHKRFSIRLSVSAPNMAERTFRTHYLKNEIALPPREVIAASFRAYHGGRNLPPPAPGLYPRVAECDIVSAYPWAMTELPPVDVGEWKAARWTVGDPIRAKAIYILKALVKKKLERPMFWHDTLDDSQHFVTGHELIEAMRCDELEPLKPHAVVSGDEYYFEPGEGADTPFARYCEDFFRRKAETPKSHPDYLFWKIGFLNSLYGKTIQRVMTDPSLIVVKPGAGGGSHTLQFIGGKSDAGGMFHPFIASLVTGFTRAYLHWLGTRYGSLHESTDSLHVLPEALDRMRTDNLFGAKMGQLEIKAEGPALFLRNKLYVLWNLEGKIAKYALHGFQGNVYDLLAAWKHAQNVYTFTRMNKPREALRLGLKPFRFEEREASVNVSWPKFQDSIEVDGREIKLQLTKPKTKKS